MGLSKKNADWLKKHCPGRLDGKRYLITGANSGIGFQTARIYRSLGASLVLACRNEKKAQEAKEKLLSEFGEAEIEIEILDLASFDSIDSFCKRVLDGKMDLNGFVFNAGVCAVEGETKDGYELVMGTNYIGTRRLFEGIRGYLSSLHHPVDVFFTTSLSHHFAKVRTSLREHQGKSIANYACSKLVLASYVRNVASSEAGNLRIYLTHPGVAITPIVKKGFAGFLYKAARCLNFLFNSNEKSALAAPCLSLCPAPSGEVYGPNGLLWVWGYPKKNRPSRRAERLRGRVESLTEDFLETANARV